MTCGPCPCPAAGLTCLGPSLPFLCAGVATGDPVLAAHAVNRSALGPDPTPTDPGPPPGPSYRVMRAAVVTGAALCRSCPTGCQAATCFAGLGLGPGRDVAPLGHCFQCVTGRRPV